MIDLNSTKEREWFLEIWYKKFPTSYSSYHQAYNAHGKSMISALELDEEDLYNTIKEEFEKVTVSRRVDYSNDPLIKFINRTSFGKMIKKSYGNKQK